MVSTTAQLPWVSMTAQCCLALYLKSEETSFASWLWSLAANAGATKPNSKRLAIAYCFIGCTPKCHPSSMKYKSGYSIAEIKLKAAIIAYGRGQNLYDSFCLYAHPLGWSS